MKQGLAFLTCRENHNLNLHNGIKREKKVNLHTDRAVRRVVSRERDNKSLDNNSLVRKMAARSRIKGKGKSPCRCFKGTVSIFCGLGG